MYQLLLLALHVGEFFKFLGEVYVYMHLRGILRNGLEGGTLEWLNSVCVAQPIQS